jgi:hypothetical protein
MRRTRRPARAAGGPIRHARQLEETEATEGHAEAHHCGQTFKEEELALLRKHNIEYDERYLWV